MLTRNTAALLLEHGYDVIFLIWLNQKDFLKFREEDRFTYPFPERIRAFRVQDLCDDLPAVHGYPNDSFERSVGFAWALQKLVSRSEIDLVEFVDYCGPSFHWFASPASIGMRTAIRIHSTIELINRKTGTPATPQRCLDFALEHASLGAAGGVLYSGPRFFAEDVAPLYPQIAPERALASPPVLWPIGEVRYHPASRDVVFFGRLSTIKGLDTFLSAAVIALSDPAFAEWVGRFLVFGPPEHVASLLTLEQMKAVIPAEMLGRFEFAGLVKHDELLRRLGTVAYAAFANKVESFCYAAHELHTAGVPLIVSSLPTFRDHFEDGESAVFFDGTARDLAAKMIALAADQPLRTKLSEVGRERAPDYLRDMYGAHLGAVQPRLPVAGPIGVSILIFSRGDAAAEATTLRSLGRSCVNALVLRPQMGGWSLSGTPLAAISTTRDEECLLRVDESSSPAGAALLPLGGAILGLRAGDVVLNEWLDEAALVMGADPAIGALACWTRRHGEIETAADHVIVEQALFDNQGLRRLIRIQPGLIFGELAARMKSAGEVGLITAARSAGQAVLESPRVGVDVSRACAGPPFDIKAALAAEYDRLDHAYLAVRRSSLEDSASFGDDSHILARLYPDRCLLRARPDIQPGEVGLIRAYRSEGALQVPRDDVAFSDEWSGRETEAGQPGAYMVTSAGGTASFTATPSGAIEVLKGPSCGALEVFLGGERRVLRLRTEAEASEVVRFSELFGLEPPVREPARASSFSEDHLLRIRNLADTLPPSRRALLLAGPDGWAMRRSGLGVLGRSSAFSPHELSGGEAPDSARYVLGLAELLGAKRLLVEISDERQFKVLEELTELRGSMGVVAILSPVAGTFGGRTGYAADVAATAAVYALARRRRDAFVVAAGRSYGLTMFEAAGLATAVLGELPPSIPRQPEGGPVDIVVIGTSRLVPSRTHLVTAAIRARQLGVPLSTLWVPKDDLQAQTVAMTLGIRNVKSYARPDLAVSGRAIALATFPDPIGSRELDDAVSAGCIPLAGPAGLWRTGLLPPSLTVQWWEDADTIAGRIVDMLNDWPQVSADLAAAADEGRRLALADASSLLLQQESGKAHGGGGQ